MFFAALMSASAVCPQARHRNRFLCRFSFAVCPHSLQHLLVLTGFTPMTSTPAHSALDRSIWVNVPLRVGDLW